MWQKLKGNKENVCRSVLILNFDDLSLLSAAKQDPAGFVEALPEQITLDEVQRVPELMPAIKSTVDKTGKFCCSTVDLIIEQGRDVWGVELSVRQYYKEKMAQV